MQPIGLTMKDITYNPFTKRTSGELMLVHQCLSCSKISCNRIAGDDYPDSILSLLDQPGQSSVITMLSLADKEQVLVALFGYNHPDI